MTDTLAVEKPQDILSRCAAFIAHKERLKPQLENLSQLVIRSILPKGYELGRRKRSLYFIISGELEVKQWGGLRSSRTYGPGSAVGLESVARWYTPFPLLNRSPVAVATRDTVVLELGWLRFQLAFGGSMQQPLLQHLLAVFNASERADEIVDVLASMPRLASANTRALYRLAESAVWIETTATSLSVAEQDRLSSSAYVLLKGSCEILRNNDVVAVHDAPTCVGLTEAILKQPMTGTVRLVGSILEQNFKAARISGDWLHALRLANYEFDRAVHRGSRELAPKPKPLKQRKVSVLAATPTLAASSRALTPLLAEAIASSMYERVLSVSIDAGPRPEPGTAPALSDISEPKSPSKNGSGWVKTAVWHLPKLDENRGKLRETVHEDDVNVLLVDTTGHPEGYAPILEGLRKEFAPEEVSLKLLFLGKLPQDFPNADELSGSGVDLVPVVMLEERPATGLGLALFKARKEGASRSSYLAAAWKALHGTAKVSREALTEELLAWVKKPRDQVGWPLGATRVRFPPEWFQAQRPSSFADVKGPERDSLLRWARAATGRKVGVALGGGGALGYVHIALLQRLLAEEELSIDLVSGSSFGAVVAAYYCGAGEEGLELVCEHWPLLSIASLLGAISSYGVQLGVDVDLGFLDLTTLEVPFLPVVTDANIGVEADVRFGTVGRGTRASGSLPPTFGPTILGDKRMLDGGLVANVPIHVLLDEGANLILASNPIARVEPRSRPKVWIPVVTRLWGEFNPLLRLSDSLRMSVIMGRAAGESQNSSDSVVMYSAESTGTSMLSLISFGHARMIVEQAYQSLEVIQAVLELKNRWYASLNNPPLPYKEVRDTQTGRLERLELKDPVLFRSEEIDPIACPQLHRLAQALAPLYELKGFTLTATGPDAPTARERAGKIEQLLRESGIKQQVNAMAGEVFPASFSYVHLTELDGNLDNRSRGELMHVLAEREKELKALRQRGMAGWLTLNARKLLAQGEVELARLLALEAAQRGNEPVTQDVLRTVLAAWNSRLMEFHPQEGNISAVAWSPDGQWLAVGAKEGEVLILDAASGKTLGAFGKGIFPIPTVHRLLWSKRDDVHQLVATGNHHSSVAVWAITPQASSVGSSLQMFIPDLDPTKPRRATSLALSPDGRFIMQTGDTVDASERTKISRIIDLSGTVLPVQSSLNGVRISAWKPQGTCLVTADAEGVLALHELRDGSFHKQELLAGEKTYAVAWHPKDSLLAIYQSQWVTIISSEPGSTSSPLKLDHKSVWHIEWSPDGKHVLTVSTQDRTVRVWNGKSGSLEVVLPHQTRCKGASWQPTRNEEKQGSRLLVTWNEAGAWLWDVKLGECRGRLLDEDKGIEFVAWRPDGKYLLVGTRNRVQVWEPDLSNAHVLDACHTPDQVRPGKHTTHQDEPGKAEWYQGHQPLSLQLPLASGSSTWVSWSPDGQWAALASKERSAPLFWRQGESPAEALETNSFGQVLWSPDGSKLAWREDLQGVSIWSPQKVEPLGRIQGQVSRAHWNTRGDLLLLQLRRNQRSLLEIWGPDFEQAPSSLPLSTSADSPHAWHPDGRQLATVASDSSTYVIVIYEVETGKRLWEVPKQKDDSPLGSMLSWSPDGSLLAVASAHPQGVYLWNGRGEDLLAGTKQPEGIQSLVWSPKGTYLFAATSQNPNDPRACPGLLWGQDPSGKWRLQASLDSSPEEVRWAAFSRDERWLVVMRTDGKARLYPVGLATLKEEVAALSGRNELTEEEISTYLGEARPLWKPGENAKPEDAPPG